MKSISEALRGTVISLATINNRIKAMGDAILGVQSSVIGVAKQGTNPNATNTAIFCSVGMPSAEHSGDTVFSAVERVDGRFVSVAKQGSDSGVTLTGVSGVVDDIKESVSGLTEDVASVASGMTTIKSTATSIKSSTDKIGNFTDSTETVAHKLENLNFDLSPVMDSLGEQETSGRTMHEKVGEFTNKTDTVATKLEDMKTSLESLIEAKDVVPVTASEMQAIVNRIIAS